MCVCISNISTYGYFQIYPHKDGRRPYVDCRTPILHPNIGYNQDGFDVCLTLLDEWEADFGVDDIIQGLLFLFYEPNWDDPFTRYPAVLYDEVGLSYTEIIQKTLLGLDVDELDWAFNYEGDDLEVLKAKYTGDMINTSELPQAPPLQQNLLLRTASNIPSSPTQQQNITSNSSNDIPPAQTLPRIISSNNMNNIPSVPSLPQNITSNNVNNIPPAPQVPPNVTSDSVNRIIPVTLEAPQQIILHNSFPGPSLTNSLQHGELPLEQLADETPELVSCVRNGAVFQMCDCKHCHRQKPKHRTMRSRFVKYFGNIFLKMKRRVTRTSFHRR